MNSNKPELKYCVGVLPMMAHTGCKENHFYSFPFGQVEASIH